MKAAVSSAVFSCYNFDESGILSLQTLIILYHFKIAIG